MLNDRLDDDELTANKGNGGKGFIPSLPGLI